MSLIIDPEFNYCPSCREEYRADIATCADCGIALISGHQMRTLHGAGARPGRSMVIAEAEPVCTVRKGGLQAIKELQTYLHQQGLPSLVVKEPGAACGCRGVEVLLQVREDDLAEVLKVLAREHWETTGLADHDACSVDAVYNPEAGEALCPACGCRFSTNLAECPDCGLCFA